MLNAVGQYKMDGTSNPVGEGISMDAAVGQYKMDGTSNDDSFDECRNIAVGQYKMDGTSNALASSILILRAVKQD